MFLREVPRKRIDLSFIEIGNWCKKSSAISVNGIVSGSAFGLVAIAREDRIVCCSDGWQNTPATISCMDILFKESLDFDTKNAFNLGFRSLDTFSYRNNLIINAEFCGKFFRQVLGSIRVIL